MSEKEFCACWFRVREALYRDAMAKLGCNEYLADDCLGRLLVVLCRQRENMPSESPGGFRFYAHSKAMLRYTLMRFYTRQNTRKRKGITVSLDVATESGLIENPDVLRKAAERLRESATRAERTAEAMQAVQAAELPERWSKVYEARLRGEAVGDIAEQWGITKQTVYKMCQRTERRLQQAHRQQAAAGRDDGSFWTGEQLHAWGSVVSAAF